MSAGIRDHVFSGVKWNLIGKFGHYGAQFFVSIILARLLLPSEFGLISMLTIFTAISQAFINSGLTSALIQKKDASSADYSTVFYYNMGIALVFYSILFISSPFISDFYREPELERLTKFIALVFIINALGNVQATILRKNLEFKKLNIINIIAVIISGIVAVLMAFNDFGVYAIVGQSICFALLSNLLFWLTSNWKPGLVFSKKSFKELFGFGSKLLVSSLLDQVYSNLSTLIIGKAFSASQLGYFTRAKASRDLPIENTTGILTNIVFPIFSKTSNDDELKRYHIKFIRLIGYIIFPLMVGLAIVAEPFTVLLFSDKWLPSVKILQLLCIAGPMFPLSVILMSVILAKGKSGLFLKIDVLKKVVGALSMIIALFFGFYPFLLGIIGASVISLFLNFYYTGRLINTKIKEYIFSLLPNLCLSLVMGGAIYLLGLLLPENYYIQILVQAVSGIVIYIALSKIFRIQDYYYLKGLIREKFDRIISKRKHRF